MEFYAQSTSTVISGRGTLKKNEEEEEEEEGEAEEEEEEEEEEEKKKKEEEEGEAEEEENSGHFYSADKGDHTARYKISKNIYIKPQNNI